MFSFAKIAQAQAPETLSLNDVMTAAQVWVTEDGNGFQKDVGKASKWILCESWCFPSLLLISQPLRCIVCPPEGF